MSEKSAIEWTDATWNPWRGCRKISPGCRNCYMFTEQVRYGKDPSVIVRSKTTFRDPLKWKEPREIFTCSWSDFLIKSADEWREEAWCIIRRTPHHTYQILTKRIDRAGVALPHDWPLPNVILGVSVEDRKHGLPRIAELQKVPGRRFISFEPLLEDLGDVDLTGIHWAIVGGESGPGARPLEVAWARSIVRQCREQGVPVFVKQMGARNDIAPKTTDRKGGDMDEWPEDLRIRQAAKVIA